MMTLSEIHEEAKKYAPDSEPLRDAFVAGARWMASGKYYKPAELFNEQQSVDLENSEEQVIVRLREDLIPSFDEFWEAYSYKKGKKKAEEKWNKLKPSEKIACMKAVPSYVDNTCIPNSAGNSRKQYRMHPLTYLNGARWEDEIYKSADYEQQRNLQRAQRAANLIASAYRQG